jgi:hypothetical protein
LIVLAVFSACKGRNSSAQTPQSETIAPAAAKPAPTGTDAMTQTVDIEDSRSDAEGAGLNQPPPAKTTTAAAVKRKTGAAASSRKTPPSQSRPPGRTQ